VKTKIRARRKLAAEGGHAAPGSSLAVKELPTSAFVTLERVASLLLAGLDAVLRAQNLTAPQYNVLRILRGAGGEGLPCGAVAGRMITRDPDVTRLIDRLEAQRLVARARSVEDRRVVLLRIAAPGLEVLSALDAPVRSLHREQFARLGRLRLRKLVALLEVLAAAPGVVAATPP
jgi:DNA-binding MarR family transcriptional regulator